MTHRIITANRLDDGVVVYLTAGGGWSDRIGPAARARDDDEAAALEARAAHAVADRLVVGPYLMPVAVDGDGIRPLSMRETIRAAGPSIMIPTESEAHVRL